MVMRRVLGSVLPAVLLVTALGACSDDTSDEAKDEPSSSASASEAPSETATDDPSGDLPSSATGEVLEFELVDTLTGTAAGGVIAPDGVPLPDEAAAQEFVSQFTTDGLRSDVLQAAAAAEVPDGQVLYGAVVALGCDVPSDFLVTSQPEGIFVVAQKVTAPKQECFAAMTTVVLVTISVDDVP